MGYREPEIRSKSPGEIQSIFKAYERLQELAESKPGTTYKIKRKTKRKTKRKKK